MVRTDSLGQEYTLNGFMAYCSVNNNRSFQGLAATADAPALSTPVALATVTLTLSSVAFSVAYTVTPLAAATYLAVFASPQRSAGRSFEGDYRFIQLSAAAAASPLNILTAYTAKFGVPVTTNRIFVSAKTLTLGFESGPFNLSQIVA
jgi:hypothetical protein